MSDDPMDSEISRLQDSFDNRPSSVETLSWQLADLVRTMMAASLSTDPVRSNSKAYMAFTALVDELARQPAGINLMDSVRGAAGLLSVWDERGYERDRLTVAAMDGGRYLLELSRRDSYAAGRRSRAREQFVSSIRAIDGG